MPRILHFVGVPGVGVGQFMDKTAEILGAESYRNDRIKISFGGLVKSRLEHDEGFRKLYEQTIASWEVLPPEAAADTLMLGLKLSVGYDLVCIKGFLHPSRLEIAEHMGILGSDSLTLIFREEKLHCLRRAKRRNTAGRHFHRNHRQSAASMRQLETALRNRGKLLYVVENAHHASEHRLAEVLAAIATMRHARTEIASSSRTPISGLSREDPKWNRFAFLGYKESERVGPTTVPARAFPSPSA